MTNLEYRESQLPTPYTYSANELASAWWLHPEKGYSASELNAICNTYRLRNTFMTENPNELVKGVRDMDSHVVTPIILSMSHLLISEFPLIANLSETAKHILLDSAAQVDIDKRGQALRNNVIIGSHSPLYTPLNPSTVDRYSAEIGMLTNFQDYVRSRGAIPKKQLLPLVIRNFNY